MLLNVVVIKCVWPIKTTLLSCMLRYCNSLLYCYSINILYYKRLHIICQYAKIRSFSGTLKSAGFLTITTHSKPLLNSVGNHLSDKKCNCKYHKVTFYWYKSLCRYSLLIRPRQNSRLQIAEIPFGEYILYPCMFLNRFYILTSDSSQTCKSVSFPPSFRFFPVAAAQEIPPLAFCLHLPLSLWYLRQFNLLEFTALKK